MRPETSEKKEFAVSAEQTLQTAGGGGNILFESGGEFVLPDYLPKVQKVLRLEANVLPPAKYMSGSEAQMSGSVLHSLIYLGEDGETSATVLPSKYEFAIPTAGLTMPEVEAAVLVDSLTYRLSAPRKINIRTRLCAKPQVFSSQDIAPKQTPEKIGGLHTLCGELDGVYTHFLKLPDIEIADTIDASGAELRPIWCGATAAVTDVRTAQDGATLRGDVYAKVLVIDGETPKMLQKKIPFEERADCELPKGAALTARADVISTEAGREQDGGNIYVETVVGISCRIDEARRIPATLDAFSETAEGEISLRKVPTEKLIFSRCGVYGAGGSVPRAGAGAADATAVLDTSGSVSVDDVRAEGGRITVSGRCALNSIYATADGESAGDCTFPFKIALDAEMPAETEATAFARLAAARARLDGDNLVCDADIFLCVRASLRGESEIVSAVDFTAAKPHEKSAYPLSIVYPHGDSLWTLAKANRVSPERLAKINHLTVSAEEMRNPEALTGKTALMIEYK